VKFNFPLTERQQRLVDSTARILAIGAGTKTGKSLALYVWLIRGMLQGEPCAFCGPWFFRSRAAFDVIKNLLQPFIAGRTVRVNEARLQISAVGGGYIDFVSADNPNCLFGANYARVVLDEASRMPEPIYAAALTTISGTNGSLRMAFNLDLGSRNWAIRNLLRIQRLTEEERKRTGEDFAMFPTGGDGLVSDELIAQFKSQMPLVTWEALYLARIPDSDSSLFRNLDKIFTGKELTEPAEGTTYMMGVDLARKTDFTSVTIIDGRGDVVAGERFSQMDWSLQIGRVALLYRTFKCVKAIVDATGVGDPVAEQLEGLELSVERYIFTVPSRKALIEELVLACDNNEIRIPSSAKFQVYRAEMDSFEYQLDGSTMRYGAPSSMHDDTVMSLALAVHGWRASRGAVLGVIDLFKRRAKEIAQGIRDAFGELIHKHQPKPVPVLARKPAITELQAPARKPNDPCPACGATCTYVRGNGDRRAVLHCNQCGAEDGVKPGPSERPGHTHRWRPIPGGQEKCDDCGEQRWIGAPPAVNGISRAQYAARSDVFGRGQYGRFG
jgi:hypothetical protein